MSSAICVVHVPICFGFFFCLFLGSEFLPQLIFSEISLCSWFTLGSIWSFWDLRYLLCLEAYLSSKLFIYVIFLHIIFGCFFKKKWRASVSSFKWNPDYILGYIHSVTYSFSLITSGHHVIISKDIRQAYAIHHGFSRGFYTPLFTCSLMCLEFSGISVPLVPALCFHLAVSWADSCRSSYDGYFYSDPPLFPSKVVLHHSRSFQDVFVCLCVFFVLVTWDWKGFDAPFSEVVCPWRQVIINP